MVVSILKKAREESSKDNKNNSVYSAVVDGLNEMDRQGVDRIILTLYESEPSENTTGRWISADESNYYPFEMLDDTEQGMIRAGKHYTVVALVRDNVGGVVRYGDKGVEVTHRTHIIPRLPKIKAESLLNYVTLGGVHSGDNLKQFTESVANNGWNPEAIEQRVKAGIEEYRLITHKLMDAARVYIALERMEQRKYSPFEQIINDMRSNIASPKGK